MIFPSLLVSKLTKTDSTSFLEGFGRLFCFENECKRDSTSSKSSKPFLLLSNEKKAFFAVDSNSFSLFNNSPTFLFNLYIYLYKL